MKINFIFGMGIVFGSVFSAENEQASAKVYLESVCAAEDISSCSDDIAFFKSFVERELVSRERDNFTQLCQLCSNDLFSETLLMKACNFSTHNYQTDMPTVDQINDLQSIVALLVAHGADVDHSNYDSNCLLAACGWGHYGIALMLLRAGASVENKWKYAYIMQAARSEVDEPGFNDLTEELLKKDAVRSMIQYREKDAPLFWFADSKKMTFLQERLGPDINWSNEDGKTILHHMIDCVSRPKNRFVGFSEMACVEQFEEAIRLGANVNKKITGALHTGDSPLHYAAGFGCALIVKKLLEFAPKHQVRKK